MDILGFFDFRSKPRRQPYAADISASGVTCVAWVAQLGQCTTHTTVQPNGPTLCLGWVSSMQKVVQANNRSFMTDVEANTASILGRYSYHAAGATSHSCLCVPPACGQMPQHVAPYLLQWSLLVNEHVVVVIDPTATVCNITAWGCESAGGIGYFYQRRYQLTSAQVQADQPTMPVDVTEYASNSARFFETVWLSPPFALPSPSPSLQPLLPPLHFQTPDHVTWRHH